MCFLTSTTRVISLPVWLLGDPGERKPVPGAHYVTHVAALLHPLSRGTVHITSADPKVYPAVDPNYLADPRNTALIFLDKTLIHLI